MNAHEPRCPDGSDCEDCYRDPEPLQPVLDDRSAPSASTYDAHAPSACIDCLGTRTMGCNASPAADLCESCYLHRQIATARREALEEAAKECDGICHYMAGVCAAAIRALKP